MEISTTNSALTSSSVDIPAGTGGSTVAMPIINERRASTSVSVQSGQSILIGGLIETMQDDRTKKVPYLGDIPGLGVLFRSKTKVTNRKELLILLTPQVLLMGTEHAEDWRCARDDPRTARTVFSSMIKFTGISSVTACSNRSILMVWGPTNR